MRADTPQWRGVPRTQRQIYFEPNRGQAHPLVRFVGRGPAYDMLMLDDGLLFLSHSVRSTLVRLSFEGASKPRQVIGRDLLPARSRYDVRGRYVRPAAGVERYVQAVRPELYPGVDLVAYGSDGDIEYDFEIAPDADPSVVSFRIDGSLGVEIEHGDLSISTADGTLRQLQPVVYEEDRGLRTELCARYVRHQDGSFGIDVDGRSAGRKLVIDPKISFLSYLGGSSFDMGTSVAVSSGGRMYVGGVTNSLDFPPNGQPNPSLAGFLTRLSADRTAIEASIYFPSEVKVGIDPFDHLLVAGRDDTNSFPRLQPSFGGYDGNNGDSYVAMYGSDFTLLNSVALGLQIEPVGVHADAAGNIYVGAFCSSCTVFAAQPQIQIGPARSAVIIKVTPTFSDIPMVIGYGGLQAFVPLGGTETMTAFTVDPSGRSYVAGTSEHFDLKLTANAFRSHHVEDGDGYIAAFNPDGTLLYATYFGPTTPTNYHIVLGIAADNDTGVYVAATTTGLVPVPNGFQQSKTATGCPYVYKFRLDTGALEWGTYLCGSGSPLAFDLVKSLGVTKAKEVTATGVAFSSDFPTTTTDHKTTLGTSDCFVSRLSSDGTKLAYSALIGGNGDEECTGLVLDKAGSAYIAGDTSSLDLQTVSPLQSTNRGSYDALIAKIDFDGNLLIFIPGNPASKLKNGADTLWPPTALQVLGGVLNRLIPSPNDGVQAYDVTDNYLGLLQFLTNNGYTEYKLADNPALLTASGCDLAQTSATLFRFPYDWRLSSATSAVALDSYIQCIQVLHPGKKIAIVAHSNGGLVARRYLLDHPGSPVDRVITFGSPFLGAPGANWVLETGDFLEGLRGFFVNPFIRGSMKRLAAASPGEHELLPSDAYFTINTPPVPGVVLRRPISEQGWDINRNGVRVEAYTLSQYSDFLNMRYGPAARANSTSFHSFLFGAQDDWSGDSTTVDFTHFIGVQSDSNTTDQIVFLQSNLCRGVGPVLRCTTENKVVPRHGPGDGTVPRLSAERQASNNYNAPRATVKTLEGLDPRQFQHDTLVNHPQLRQWMLLKLQATNPASVPLLSRSTVQGLSVRAQDATPPFVEASYVTILDAGNYVVSDLQGNSTANSPDGLMLGEVPGATPNFIDDQSLNAVLALGSTYKITFTSAGSPILVESLRGIGEDNLSAAVRYLDVDLPAGTKLQLTRADDGTPALAYDSHGTGVFDTPISPTAAVSGPAAADTQPPVVTFSFAPRSGGISVSITANDVGTAGVRRTYYSTDGSNFNLYSAPSVAPAAAQRVYAFSEDNAANRSAIVDAVIPTVTSIDYTGGTSVHYGGPLAVSARVTRNTDKSPVAGLTVSFTIGAATVSAVTDSHGRAVASLAPQAHPGKASIVVAFAGTPQYLASQTSEQVTIVRDEVKIVMDEPPGLLPGLHQVTATIVDADNGTPLPGKTISFSVGPSTTPVQSSERGVAIASFNLSAYGAVVVSASFAGDIDFAAADAHQTIYLYQQTSFVVWGGEKSDLKIGKRVQFWGENWSKQLDDEGERDQFDNFKGFVRTRANPPVICEPLATRKSVPPLDDQCWTATEADKPVGKIPSYIGVLVTSSISQKPNKGAFYGNIAALVILSVEGQTNDHGELSDKASGEVVAVISGKIPTSMTVKPGSNASNKR